MLGGPLYQMFRRTHLAGDALELLRRRVIAIAAVAWLPLLILSALGGHAWGSAVRVPFIMDVEVHVRFLLAIPLLVVAELVVHQRMRPLVRQFLERDLIAESSRARFDEAVASALRLRNSVTTEIVLIAFVYLVGVLYIWPRFVALPVPTWYATPTDGGRTLFPAGWWYVYVSLPIFQFLFYRWAFRLFLWIRFLWQTARCELRLVPTHPDHAGGLSFLAGTVLAFAPLLAAHGSLLAGVMANQIFFDGAKLPDFKVQVGVILGFLLVAVLGPLFLFSPQMARARRVGLREYGVLASRYVREFDEKWIRGGAPPDEPLVGSGDIQSLADLGNSFESLRSMSLVPFTRNTIVQLAVIALVPIAPLLLTMIPLEELLTQLLKVVF